MTEYTIGASLPEFEPEEDIFKARDPFNKEWEELKGYAGIEKNFKRRADRTVNKLFDTAEYTGVNTSAPGYQDVSRAFRAGREDARSKEINPGDVFRNGYGLFDVITPPWNLYELANYYDTSFANHAAIDAKVENIVGLGYDFDISRRTMLKLESSEDQAAVDRARNRIERAKIELKDWMETLNRDESFTNVMTKFYTDVQATGNGYLEIGRTINGQIGYLGHIPATTMRVRRQRDGYVQIIGNKVVYFRNFGAKNPNPIT